MLDSLKAFASPFISLTLGFAIDVGGWVCSLRLNLAEAGRRRRALQQTTGSTGAVKLFEDLAGGAVGHSCADTCAAAGMVCAQASFRERISAYNPSDAEYAAMFQVVGMTCGSISRELNAAVLPMWTSGGTCYVASDSSGSLATCDTVAEAEEDARRMCFCSPSAGQHSCWSHPDVQGIDTAGSTAPFGLAHSAALDALNLNSFNVTVITTLTDAASGRSWAPLWFASSGGEDPSLPGLRLGDAAGGANTVLMVGMADGTSSSSRSFEFVNPLTAGVETTFQLVCSRVDSASRDCTLRVTPAGSPSHTIGPINFPVGGNLYTGAGGSFGVQGASSFTGTLTGITVSAIPSRCLCMADSSDVSSSPRQPGPTCHQCAAGRIHSRQEAGAWRAAREAATAFQ
ncbi:hypothetical protein CYMTET_25969, partial [Cymbomonas tetramitiformis]